MKYSISPTPNPFAISMARRGRGHVDIDLRDGGVIQQRPQSRPYKTCSLLTVLPNVGLFPVGDSQSRPYKTCSLRRDFSNFGYNLATHLHLASSRRFQLFRDLVFFHARQSERAIVVDINPDHASQAKLSRKDAVRQPIFDFVLN